MNQQSFAEMEYANKRRQTRRERFLGQMERLAPWKRLESRIEPHYPNSGGPGRPPYSLSVMLRVHCMQLFYNLSDPAMEDALYEIESMRRFAGLKLNRSLPDETTIHAPKRGREKAPRKGVGNLFQSQGLNRSHKPPPKM